MIGLIRKQRARTLSGRWRVTTSCSLALPSSICKVKGARFNKLRTVMRIIKLKTFPVPVRLHSGYGKLICVTISPFSFQYLRTLYIVWSLVRRQTMYNVLKYRKNDEIKTKSQFTATATEPHRNRKFRQFNNDQYCN